MIARFVQGNDRFDLLQDPFSVVSFIPPAMSTEYQTVDTAQGEDMVGSVEHNVTLELGLMVRVVGSTAPNLALFMAKVRSLESFLRSHLNKATPLFYEHCDVDVPEPVYGTFGAPDRYEIVSLNNGQLGDDYEVDVTRENCIHFSLSLSAKPAMRKTPQRLLTGYGTLVEDRLGVPGGGSRGLSLTTPDNLIANPIFANATWNTDWSAGANLTVNKSTDLRYRLPGAPCSALLSSKGNTNNAYTITTGVLPINTYYYLTAFVSAPGMTLAQINSNVTASWDGGTRTFNWYSLGGDQFVGYDVNMWMSATTHTAGIAIASKYACYLMGARLTTPATADVISPIATGDMIGYSWASTRHASATRVTALGRLTVPSVSFMNSSYGAVLFVWSPRIILTSSGLSYLFSFGNSSIRGFFTNNTFKFWDGVNTAITRAFTEIAIPTTFTSYHVLFTWGPAGGLKIYVNGVLEATAAYTPTVLGTLYIGSDASGTNQIPGTISGFQLYNQELSLADVQALYAAGKPVTDAGHALNSIPFFWTGDGDNVTDNADDSTHKNYGVIGGVEGALPANLIAYITPTVTPLCWWIGRVAVEQESYLPALSEYNFDFSGNVTGVTEEGAAVKVITLGTTPDYELLAPLSASLYQGRTHYLARIYSAVTPVNVAPGFHWSTTSTLINGKTKVLNTTNAFRWFYVGSMDLTQPDILDPGYGDRPGLAPYLKMWRGSGSGDVWLDFVMLIPGPLAKISVSAASAGDLVLIKNGSAVVLTGATRTIADLASYTGDWITLEPGKLNTMFWVSGADGGAHVIADTATWSVLFVEPRYGLL